ncbi:MAG TPA: CheR family methyltransferase [Noviherbaspirillum sp.]|nr:CheR family methyltransferase [Noviherbaspirillum sp.]
MKRSEGMSMPDRMGRLAEKIESEMGLSFSGLKRRDLHGAVHRMAESKGLEDDVCIDWLLSGPWDKPKSDLCALHLTIGETYFFREPRALDMVCDYARKKMQDCDGTDWRLRVWSAGCCTGEEPYSIAMALKQTLPELALESVSILATDINSRHLQVARDGVYRQWSFRSTGTALQNRHFSEQDDSRFQVNEDIKTAVKFAELNLAAAVYPSVATDTHAMDIIFCRNVLMYFSREQAKRVIERFRHCLVDGGWLIVSPSEASSELFAGFTGLYHPDAIYFQKKVGVQAGKPPLHLCSTGSLPEEGQRQDSACRTPHHARVQSGPRAGKPIRAKRKSVPALKEGVAQEEAANSADRSKAGTDAVIVARALANQGQAAGAMRLLEQAIAAGPPTAALYHAKALIAMEVGDQRDALQNLRRVVYLQPDFILAHYLMGVLQSTQNKRGEAIRQFGAADELLAALDDDDIVPGSDGLHVAYLRESIRAYLRKDGQ